MRCGVGHTCVAGECVGPRRAFVTSGQIQPYMLGGLAAADAFCQGAADTAGLAGTYLAWLSTDTESPSTRFAQSSAGYMRLNGQMIATDWPDLIDGTITAAIALDEFGDVSPSAGLCSALTNTHADGTSHTGFTCENLTGVGSGGVAGLPNRGTSLWTDGCSNTALCTGNLRLYCFEQ